MSSFTPEQDKILCQYFTKYYLVHGANLTEWMKGDNEIDDKLWGAIERFPYVNNSKEMPWVVWVYENLYMEHMEDEYGYNIYKLTNKFIDEVIGGE